MKASTFLSSVEESATGTGADAARVAGLGPTQEIVISDTMMQTATPGELEFLIARFSAHVAAHDNLKLDLYVSLWLIVAAVISVTLADRIGFRRDDDPLSRLALLGTLSGTCDLAVCCRFKPRIRAAWKPAPIIPPSQRWPIPRQRFA